MAPRQTARRLLVAAPALALALAVTACSPPNEQPADPDAPYTLPTYSEEAEPTTSSTAPEAAEGENADAEGAAGAEAGVEGAEGAAAEGTAAEGAETGVDADGTATGDAQAVPGQGQQAGQGMNAPAAPPVQPAP